jgi:hypothetical protein
MSIAHQVNFYGVLPLSTGNDVLPSLSIDGSCEFIETIGVGEAAFEIFGFFCCKFSEHFLGLRNENIAEITVL